MADQFPHTYDQYIDPHATLSNADVVRFLMEDTSSKIAELWKDVRNELDLDRKHNQEINKRVVEGLGKRIDILDNYLITSLNHESITTLPVSTLDQPTFSCNLCAHSFPELSSLDEHIETTHPSLLCEECGKTLRSQPDLYLHLHRHHGKSLKNP